MENPATTTSKEPSGVNVSSIFHSRMLTLSSPLNRSSARSSMAGDESTATHALHTLAMLEYQGGQPAVAATQVEHRAW